MYRLFSLIHLGIEIMLKLSRQVHKLAASTELIPNFNAWKTGNRPWMIDEAKLAVHHNNGFNSVLFCILVHVLGIAGAEMLSCVLWLLPHHPEDPLQSWLVPEVCFTWLSLDIFISCILHTISLRLGPGRVIIKEGHLPSCFYFILSGTG